MSNWKEYKFSELCNISRGASPRPIHEYITDGEGMPWVKIADATKSNSRFIEDTAERIKLSGVKKSVEVFEGDLILSNSATPGLPKFMAINACIHDGWMLLRNFKNITKEFAYWLLLNERTNLVKQGTGTVFINLKTDILRNHIVKIPSIEEQNKIVSILNGIEDKIHLNTQINQTLEQIAQALFKSWFVDFDPVRAKVQALSGGLSLEQAELAAMQAISGKTPEELTALSQTQPDRYAELAETAKAFPCEMVEVDGVEVPKGWEVKRIDEVIQKIPVGKKYSSKIAFSEGLVPILDQGRSGVIGYHNDKPGVKASIEDPIIVFANHTCYMRLISYDFSAIQNVFAFKGKECNLYWLYLATLGKQEFVEYKGHFPDFLIKEIIVPPEELTELFGKYVKENFSKIFINDRENSNLAKIRDLLLPKLLNGEV
ncbi:restriction endonuclease HindVIIP subunit S [Haemophilus influenzae]|uniref:restriction endonuclease subunit S n=1 Tax=Haemophilus influenzae TaxID=727 RepID=UPI000681008C|nr:restriction endonuclease subunit S [Haemophilus influenzae]KMZ28565.1 restriction endonuclease HindVIIP subunit S [Haemophilus influenzae]MBZ5690826.1 restriction endonuclease subunit S [Haemophilus influenzae]MCK8913708.1 restriction endonuclease subunit S [Haemophilus influenzae]